MDGFPNLGHRNCNSMISASLQSSHFFKWKKTRGGGQGTCLNAGGRSSKSLPRHITRIATWLVCYFKLSNIKTFWGFTNFENLGLSIVQKVTPFNYQLFIFYNSWFLSFQVFTFRIVQLYILTIFIPLSFWILLEYFEALLNYLVPIWDSTGLFGERLHWIILGPYKGHSADSLSTIVVRRWCIPNHLQLLQGDRPVPVQIRRVRNLIPQVGHDLRVAVVTEKSFL